MGFTADTLQDRVAIVTGASQGIGRAIAVELAKVGAHVVLCSRRLTELEAISASIREQGRQALALACDVGDVAQVSRVVRQTVDRFGRIDLLVNNAGYRVRAAFEKMPIPEWHAMVQTNLTGVILFCQEVGRVMIGQQAGKIINITSTAGHYGSRGMAAYAATKGAVTVLTKSLGAEWAKYGLRVNAVSPGPVETEGALDVWKTPAMIAQASDGVPMRRLGRSEEVAWAVVFLASDLADYTTGETLHVSGGPKTSSRED